MAKYILTHLPDLFLVSDPSECICSKHLVHLISSVLVAKTEIQTHHTTIKINICNKKCIIEKTNKKTIYISSTKIVANMHLIACNVSKIQSFEGSFINFFRIEQENYFNKQPNGIKYSRMDQVKFVKDKLLKNCLEIP